MATAAAAPLPIALQINCGFCRVSIKELSNNSKFKRTNIDIEARERKFREQFLYQLAGESVADMFTTSSSDRTSLFNRHCNVIVNMFSKKWKTTASRLQYLSTFSKSAWEKLSQLEKKHTISNCQQCHQKHLEIQKTFPGKPIFEDSFCTAVSELISHATKKTKNQTVVSLLNVLFKRSLENLLLSLMKCPQVGLQKKRLSNEIREKRKLCRSIRDDINEQFYPSSTNKCHQGREKVTHLPHTPKGSKYICKVYQLEPR